MTGTHWIRDLETLNYPIMLTNTGSVGGVMDPVPQYTAAKHPEHQGDYLPVVAETFDGSLNDIQGRHVPYSEVAAALDSAHDGPVEEGNVGGGTGMVCFDFKCGIGTASRQLPANEGGYKIGILVQANFGEREQLMIAGGRPEANSRSQFRPHQIERRPKMERKVRSSLSWPPTLRFPLYSWSGSHDERVWAWREPEVRRVIPAAISSFRFLPRM
jgi:L-aminopeptidase/D-esterase-like protein